MIISISGKPGSGKSTLARELSRKLGWKYHYMGGLRRNAAAKRGLTLQEYNKLGETDPSTDMEVDEFQKHLGETEDNFIIDGRTSWYFIPHSLKIYLDVDETIGVQRVFNELQNANNRNEDKTLNTVKCVAESIQKRLNSDNLRYKKYFNIDVFDKNNYDYVLDTSNLNPTEALAEVYNYIKQKQK